MIQNNGHDIFDRDTGFDMAVSYDSQGRQEYVGICDPTRARGNATSDEAWLIYKLSYDSSGRMLRRRYADKSNLFLKVWDDRATYSYTDI